MNGHVEVQVWILESDGPILATAAYSGDSDHPFRPESIGMVSAFNRNQWPESIGMGGRLRPESMAGLLQNMHLNSKRRPEELMVPLRGNIKFIRRYWYFYLDCFLIAPQLVSCVET